MQLSSHPTNPVRTLYVVTLPLPIFAGTYQCHAIDATKAAAWIREAYENPEWRFESKVHAGTTARLLTEISGKVVKRYEKPRLPKPNDGDRFLYVRLASDLQREHGTQSLGILDVEFLLVEYSAP